MSNKMWEVTVEHAKTCVLDKRRYLYCPPSQQTTHVVFNAVGQVMGLFSNGQYVPADKLSDPEKACFSYPLKLLSYILCFVGHFFHGNCPFSTYLWYLIF